MLEQLPDHGGGRPQHALLLDRHQRAVEAVPGRPPLRCPQHRRPDVGNRLTVRGFGECCDGQGTAQRGRRDRLVDGQADVGDAEFDGRPLRARSDVEIDHARIDGRTGPDEQIDRRLIVGDIGERACGPGRRPARPHFMPVTRVPRVLTLPEWRIRRQRKQNREPRSDPVEDFDRGGAIFHADVYVTAVDQLAQRDGAEGLGHPQVAVFVGQPGPLR